MSVDALVEAAHKGNESEVTKQLNLGADINGIGSAFLVTVFRLNFFDMIWDAELQCLDVSK